MISKRPSETAAICTKAAAQRGTGSICPLDRTNSAVPFPLFAKLYFNRVYMLTPEVGNKVEVSRIPLFSSHVARKTPNYRLLVRKMKASPEIELGCKVLQSSA
jgi:hypothetical protein